MAEKFADAPLLSKRFDNAMQLALDHHRVHLRKDTLVPYVAHLLAVTSIVLELGGDEDEAIAALLHDAVEDGGGPMMQKRIAWEFGAGSPPS
jgi:(p)ppGpp synthase/HD superfamily hydrolase